MPKRIAPEDGRGRIARLGDASSTLLEVAAGWAERSERLTEEERAEVVRLRKKAANRQTPPSGGDRAKLASLVAKAVGTERLQRLINRPPPHVPPSPRKPSDVDAAERLERAAQLRDKGVITEEDFLKLKARYLEDL